MISPEIRAEIRRYFFAEHWKIGTIARELSIHPDAVRHAIESDRFRRGPALRASILDPYMEFVRQTLDQHPRLRFPTRGPFIWSSFSIRPRRTFCVAMCMPFKTGADNPVSSSTTISAAP